MSSLSVEAVAPEVGCRGNALFRDVTDDFDLLTSTSPGGVITVVSITGLDVTQGADPDSARIGNLAASDSRVVTVTYTVGMAPVGTIDTLIFLARPVSSPAQTDEGRLVLTVTRPNLIIAKSVNPTGTSPPGTDLTYAVILTNTGSEPAESVVNVDALPAEVEFKVGSVVNNFPGGIGVTVEYSNDGGSNWSYTPVSLGCGAPATYDACVTNIRWTLLNPLISVAPDNAGDVQFIARIK